MTYVHVPTRSKWLVFNFMSKPRSSSQRISKSFSNLPALSRKGISCSAYLFICFSSLDISTESLSIHCSRISAAHKLNLCCCFRRKFKDTRIRVNCVGKLIFQIEKGFVLLFGIQVTVTTTKIVILYCASDCQCIASSRK